MIIFHRAYCESPKAFPELTLSLPALPCSPLSKSLSEDFLHLLFSAVLSLHQPPALVPHRQLFPLTSPKYSLSAVMLTMAELEKITAIYLSVRCTSWARMMLWTLTSATLGRHSVISVELFFGGFFNGNRLQEVSIFLISDYSHTFLSHTWHSLVSQIPTIHIFSIFV